jgi:hypothetical protein
MAINWGLFVSMGNGRARTYFTVIKNDKQVYKVLARDYFL